MSSTWNTGRLGDVCRVVPGYAFKSSDWQTEGIPVVKIKNITGSNSVDLSATDYVPENLLTPKLQKFVINDGDILVAMTGATAGKVGKVRTQRPLLLNQRVAKIAPVEANPEFIWAVVSSQEYQEKFFYLADGAAQPNMSGGQIEGVEIPLPPLPIQQRIAGILSAYDELIENSQRRIRILEAMARALYREWFVHFRFPGHENHLRSASPLGEIPQGWEVKKLKDVCRLTMGQSPKSEFYNETGDGAPFHQGVTNFGDRFPTDRLFCTAEGRIAEAGDILFSVRAPVGRMNIANKKIILGRGLSAIRHVNGSQAFLWEQLRNRFTKDDMMGNGAIFASVTKDDMQGIELVCPPPSVVNAATKHFEPLHSGIATLSQQIQNLRRTRDLLLPRLLSGQIDVEAIPDPDSLFANSESGPDVSA